MKLLRFLGSFFLTLVIYAGLPLLGWGYDDLPGFFSLPQLSVYAISIVGFGLWAGATFAGRPGEMGNRGKGLPQKFVPRQRITRFLVTGLLFCGLIFIPLADRREIGILGNAQTLRWIGLVLATLGMGIIFWSGIALGRLYSPEVTLQEGHHLVTWGAYHFIRHPRYLGGIIQGIGLSLLFRSWIGLALTAIFLIVILFRIRDEEVLMSREFAEIWENYCQKTWRLIPFLY